MKRIVSIVLLIIGVFMLVSFGCSGSASLKKTSATIVALKIDAVTLYAEYKDNSIAADNKYENKLLIVTGIIISIGEDIMGSPYVVLGSGKEYEMWGVQCLFENKDELLSLRTGQTLSIRGKCNGYLINVLLKDCTRLF